MSASPQSSDASYWVLLGAELPTDLAERRVLDVAPAGDPDRVSAELASRGAAELVRWDPAAELAAGPGHFDLAICRGLMQRTPHPANLLSRLWAAIAEGGTLLLESRVMTEVERSRYAMFNAAGAGLGDSEWLPGRLALRWSVETSGFDFDRWLASPGLAPGPGEASVCLAATRTARPPSLDIAIPAPE
jgi:hypothetical protein